MKIEMNLCDPQKHLGHCQLTYWSKNSHGQKLIYCLQDNGEKSGGIRLMRCSQDGEPSHEVWLTTFKATFERPTGASRLEQLARDWIDRYERT